MSEVASKEPSFAERREHVRASTRDDVKLVTTSGRVFTVAVVDRSLRGLRLRSADVALLPTKLTVLVPSAGLAHLARLVWRTAPFAGLVLLRTVDMRAASGAHDEPLRRLWREHAAR